MVFLFRIEKLSVFMLEWMYSLPGLFIFDPSAVKWIDPRALRAQSARSRIGASRVQKGKPFSSPPRYAGTRARRVRKGLRHHFLT